MIGVGKQMMPRTMHCKCNSCGRDINSDPGIIYRPGRNLFGFDMTMPSWFKFCCLQCLSLGGFTEDEFNLFLAKRLALMAKRLRKGQHIERCRAYDIHHGQCIDFSDGKDGLCQRHADGGGKQDWPSISINGAPRSDIRTWVVLEYLYLKIQRCVRYPHDNREFTTRFADRGMAAVHIGVACFRRWRKQAHIRGTICRLDGDDCKSPVDTPYWRFKDRLQELFSMRRSFVETYDRFLLAAQEDRLFFGGYTPGWCSVVLNSGNDKYSIPLSIRLRAFKLFKKQRRIQAEQMRRLFA